MIDCTDVQGMIVQNVQGMTVQNADRGAHWQCVHLDVGMCATSLLMYYPHVRVLFVMVKPGLPITDIRWHRFDRPDLFCLVLVFRTRSKPICDFLKSSHSLFLSRDYLGWACFDLGLNLGEPGVRCLGGCES